MNVKSVSSAVELATKQYENNLDPEVKKIKSQYFTPYIISEYMSDIVNKKIQKNRLRILEPSAGTGQLIVALLIRMINYDIKDIIIDIFEIDNNLIPIINENLNLVKSLYKKNKKNIVVNIFCDNFLISKIDYKYDIIIGNPPYKKIRKDSIESKMNYEFVYGQPNIYGLFISKALTLLEEEGQLIYLVPRSFFNGKYFIKIRELIFNYYSISFIHSFESRSKIINNEILQEVVIIKFEKRDVEFTNICHSFGIDDIRNEFNINIESKTLWNKNNYKIRLPINEDDVILIKNMDNLKYKLSDFNWKFKTGSIVDFRMKNYLIESTKNHNNCFPLIWCANFTDSKIFWPLDKSKFSQYIDSEVPGTRLVNRGDYLLIKRFSSKEEHKNLKVNLLYYEDINFDKLGIENHVNYLKIDNENRKYLNGLFILFNSSYYNRYFSIINGTTQINIDDLNNLPIIDQEKLETIGNIKFKDRYPSQKECDDIIYEYIY